MNEKDHEKKEDLNEIWLNIINSINKIESECIKTKLSDKIRSEINRNVDFIERKIKAGINKKLCKEIRDLIQNEEQKLKKSFLLNKNYLFLNKNQWNPDSLFEIFEHKFLITSNENLTIDRLKNLLTKMYK